MIIGIFPMNILANFANFRAEVVCYNILVRPDGGDRVEEL